jgi:iron complex outermembrane recepter protein
MRIRRITLGLAAALCLASTSIIAFADGLTTVLQLSIRPQTVASALLEFSSQTHLQIVSDGAEVRGLKSPGVEGKWTAGDALKRLLDNTGLSFELVDQQTVRVFAQHASGDTKQSTSPLPGAQIGEATALNEIAEVVVTGTRLGRAAGEGVQEVRVYSKERIRQSGQGTVAGFLGGLPEVSVTIPDNASVRFANQATVQLHGMPVGTTLVLLNGRRLEVNNFGFFDLNNIPLAAVERIEVLPVGSSAIYGSDGLAGAVNIILNKDLNGFEIDGRYGAAEGGAEEANVNLAWGQRWERGDLSLVASYQDKSRLPGTERTVAASPEFDINALFGFNDACSPGTVYSTNGGNLPGLNAPRAAMPPGLSRRPAITDFTATAGTQNTCSDLRNVDLISASERAGLLGSAAYRISDSTELFSEVMVSRQAIDSRVGLVLNNFGVFSVLPASNAFNPFGEDVGLGWGYPGLPYTFKRDSDFIRPLLGLRGSLARDWTYEITGMSSYDRSEVTQSDPNAVAIAAALASSDPATALNPFSNGAPGSSELLASLIAPSHSHFRSKDISAQAILRGTLFDLPAGPVAMAFGGEYVRSKIDQFSQDLNISSEPITNRRAAYSVFTEARVPLLANAGNSAGAEKLAVSLAGRFDHTDDFGSETTAQGGVEWRPVDSLLVRGAIATAYRAPQLTQLAGPTLSSIFSFIPDPLRGGEPIDVLVASGPNPNLDPETGESRQLGFVYSNQAGLELGLTYWSIDLDDFIGHVAIADLLAFPDLFPGSIVRADPTPEDIANGFPGHIIAIHDIFRNFGTIEVSGVDLDASFALNVAGGVLKPSLSATYTSKYDSALSPSAPAGSKVSQADNNGFTPRWKGIAALTWAGGPWSFMVDGRYTSSYNDYTDFVIFGYPEQHTIEDFWLFDANVRYSIGEALAPSSRFWARTSLELGAVNLLNELPQSSFHFNGYDPQQADIRGRFWYMRLGLRL